MVSIVDRFLEHARIFHFRNGGDEEVYLASADWMPRNLDRRIELLFPVEAPEGRQKVLQALDAIFQDNVKGRRLQPDGSYKRKRPGEGRGAVPRAARAATARPSAPLDRLARRDRRDARADPLAGRVSAVSQAGPAEPTLSGEERAALATGSRSSTTGCSSSATTRSRRHGPGCAARRATSSRG